MSEPLPCPFCGHTGLQFDSGSTYRWGIASCARCGATTGEVRRNYPDDGKWHAEAIAEWNRRAQPGQAGQEPITSETGNTPDQGASAITAESGKAGQVLSDEKLWEMWVESPSDVLRFARAIEQAVWQAATQRQQERIAELEAQVQALSMDAGRLKVFYGSMPESCGRTNWTAILHRGDIVEGYTIDRSEYPHRVRYEADRVRWLIGELDKEPFILDYDADEKTPCHLCGGTGTVDGKSCWGLNFKGAVHDAAIAAGKGEG